MKNSISRVETIAPITVARFPHSAAHATPVPSLPDSASMELVTIKPIPNAVPRFVSAGIWYALKKRRNLVSLASVRIAGLSLRYVVTMPSADAPGMPNSGFISGDRILLISSTTPNSESSSEIAPAMTAIAIR